MYACSFIPPLVGKHEARYPKKRLIIPFDLQTKSNFNLILKKTCPTVSERRVIESANLRHLTAGSQTTLIIIRQWRETNRKPRNCLWWRALGLPWVCTHVTNAFSQRRPNFLSERESNIWISHNKKLSTRLHMKRMQSLLGVMTGKDSIRDKKIPAVRWELSRNQTEETLPPAEGTTPPDLQLGECKRVDNNFATEQLGASKGVRQFPGG